MSVNQSVSGFCHLLPVGDQREHMNAINIIQSSISSTQIGRTNIKDSGTGIQTYRQLSQHHITITTNNNEITITPTGRNTAEAAVAVNGVGLIKGVPHPLKIGDRISLIIPPLELNIPPQWEFIVTPGIFMGEQSTSSMQPCDQQTQGHECLQSDGLKRSQSDQVWGDDFFGIKDKISGREGSGSDDMDITACAPPNAAFATNPYPSTSASAIAEADRAAHQRKKQKMTEELECPLCLDWLAYTHTLRCTHSFCYACLKSNVRWEKNVGKCPTCNEAVLLTGSIYSMQVDRLVRVTLSDNPTALSDWEARLEDGKALHAMEKGEKGSAKKPAKAKPATIPPAPAPAPARARPPPPPKAAKSKKAVGATAGSRLMAGEFLVPPAAFKPASVAPPVARPPAARPLVILNSLLPSLPNRPQALVPAPIPAVVAAAPTQAAGFIGLSARLPRGQEFAPRIASAAALQALQDVLEKKNHRVAHDAENGHPSPSPAPIPVPVDLVPQIPIIIVPKRAPVFIDLTDEVAAPVVPVGRVLEGGEIDLT